MPATEKSVLTLARPLPLRPPIEGPSAWIGAEMRGREAEWSYHLSPQDKCWGESLGPGSWCPPVYYNQGDRRGGGCPKHDAKALPCAWFVLEIRLIIS